LAGVQSGTYVPRLYPTADDERAVEGLLAAAGVGDGFVALAPGSIWGSKRWPYYDELAGRLAPHGPIAIVGGPEDASLAQEIVAAVGRSGGRAVDACGRLTLRQSAVLIRRARVLVTNDSAPLHLASAVGTPVLALFGPTIPEFGFGPIGAGDQTLGIEGLVCRPCSDHGPPQCPLGHHRCMKTLSVTTVLAALEETGALRRRS
jgi:heptosyltransferase-2